MAFTIYDSFDEEVDVVDELDDAARERARTNEGYIIDENAGKKVFDSYDDED